MYRLALAVVLLLLPSVVVADVTGKPRVVDGDTIHIGKTKIRLHGIDAPEMKQTCHTSEGKEQMCGVLAKQALERLVRGKDVTCNLAQFCNDLFRTMSLDTHYLVLLY
jgi:endonuclease YncB( thermonuclease family)